VHGGSSGVVSAGTVGAGLGYFPGAGRLGIATIAVVTLFFGLAVSQGLIPGLGPTDRHLPLRSPALRDPARERGSTGYQP